MESRPLECGLLAGRSLQWSHVQSNVERPWDACDDVPKDYRFNGATFNRTWRGCQSGAVSSKRSRASMEPRSIERGERCVCKFCQSGYALQWSHVQSNVERVPGPLSRPLLEVASMEPRSIERGEGLSCLIYFRRLRRFNGATFNRTWRVGIARARDLSHGRPLQWSHVQSNVESDL